MPYYEVIAVGSDGRERDAWVLGTACSQDAKRVARALIVDSETLPPDEYELRVRRVTEGGAPWRDK